MTMNEDQTKELNSLGTHRERVHYAVDHMDLEPAEVTTAAIGAWLLDRGLELPRQTVSKYLNEWRKNNGVTTPKTGEQPRLTPELIAQLDAENNRFSEASPEDFGPRDDSPTSPAIATPPRAPSRPVVVSSLPPVTSAPEPSHPEPEARDTRRDTPDTATADAPATAQRDATAEGSDTSRPSWRARVWGWVVAKFVWIQYVGLLTAAAYGLYQVFFEVAGATRVVAIVGAASVELVGVSLKLLADRAERGRESHRFVRTLLIISGVIATGIGATNAIGHAHIPVEDGNPYIAAALYGVASIAGYSLWTVTTSLAHRAKLRDRGQLEGPGLRIPAYIRDRYGAEIADRAQKLSRFNARLSINAAVEQARAELDAEARESRETARREALRAGLVAHAKATHNDQLAADMESSRFSADLLSDRFTASAEEHDAKVRELLDWMASHKK